MRLVGVQNPRTQLEIANLKTFNLPPLPYPQSFTNPAPPLRGLGRRQRENQPRPQYSPWLGSQAIPVPKSWGTDRGEGYESKMGRQRLRRRESWRRGRGRKRKQQQLAKVKNIYYLAFAEKVCQPLG